MREEKKVVRNNIIKTTYLTTIAERNEKVFKEMKFSNEQYNRREKK